MTSTNNIPYYFSLVGLFILMKFLFSVANTDDLAFLLYPTNKLIEILTNSNSFYDVNLGHYHSHLNILINKSCSGSNFWIICLLMLSFLALNFFKSNPYKILSLIAAIAISYLITIFVNTSRIFVSVTLEKQLNPFLNIDNHLVHEAIGITTNLSFLILTYYIIEKLINKYFYEKLT